MLLIAIVVTIVFFLTARRVYGIKSCIYDLLWIITALITTAMIIVRIR